MDTFGNKGGSDDVAGGAEFVSTSGSGVTKLVSLPATVTSVGSHVQEQVLGYLEVQSSDLAGHVQEGGAVYNLQPQEIEIDGEHVILTSGEEAGEIILVLSTDQDHTGEHTVAQLAQGGILSGAILANTASGAQNLTSCGQVLTRLEVVNSGLLAAGVSGVLTEPATSLVDLQAGKTVELSTVTCNDEPTSCVAVNDGSENLSSEVICDSEVHMQEDDGTNIPVVLHETCVSGKLETEMENSGKLETEVHNLDAPDVIVDECVPDPTLNRFSSLHLSEQSLEDSDTSSVSKSESVHHTATLITESPVVSKDSVHVSSITNSFSSLPSITTAPSRTRNRPIIVNLGIRSSKKESSPPAEDAVPSNDAELYKSESQIEPPFINSAVQPDMQTSHVQEMVADVVEMIECEEPSKNVIDVEKDELVPNSQSEQPLSLVTTDVVSAEDSSINLTKSIDNISTQNAQSDAESDCVEAIGNKKLSEETELTLASDKDASSPRTVHLPSHSKTGEATAYDLDHSDEDFVMGSASDDSDTEGLRLLTHALENPHIQDNENVINEEVIAFSKAVSSRKNESKIQEDEQDREDEPEQGTEIEQASDIEIIEIEEVEGTNHLQKNQMIQEQDEGIGEPSCNQDSKIEQPIVIDDFCEVEEIIDDDSHGGECKDEKESREIVYEDGDKSSVVVGREPKIPDEVRNEVCEIIDISEISDSKAESDGECVSVEAKAVIIEEEQIEVSKDEALAEDLDKNKDSLTEPVQETEIYNVSSEDDKSELNTSNECDVEQVKGGTNEILETVESEDADKIVLSNNVHELNEDANEVSEFSSKQVCEEEICNTVETSQNEIGTDNILETQDLKEVVETAEDKISLEPEANANEKEFDEAVERTEVGEGRDLVMEDSEAVSSEEQVTGVEIVGSETNVEAECVDAELENAIEDEKEPETVAEEAAESQSELESESQNEQMDIDAEKNGIAEVEVEKDEELDEDNYASQEVFDTDLKHNEDQIAKEIDSRSVTTDSKQIICDAEILNNEMDDSKKLGGSDEPDSVEHEEGKEALDEPNLPNDQEVSSSAPEVRNDEAVCESVESTDDVPFDAAEGMDADQVGLDEIKSDDVKETSAQIEVDHESPKAEVVEGNEIYRDEASCDKDQEEDELIVNVENDEQLTSNDEETEKGDALSSELLGDSEQDELQKDTSHEHIDKTTTEMTNKDQSSDKISLHADVSELADGETESESKVQGDNTINEVQLENQVSHVEEQAVEDEVDDSNLEEKQEEMDEDQSEHREEPICEERENDNEEQEDEKVAFETPMVDHKEEEEKEPETSKTLQLVLDSNVNESNDKDVLMPNDVAEVTEGKETGMESQERTSVEDINLQLSPENAESRENGVEEVFESTDGGKDVEGNTSNQNQDTDETVQSIQTNEIDPTVEEENIDLSEKNELSEHLTPKIQKAFKKLISSDKIISTKTPVKETEVNLKAIKSKISTKLTLKQSDSSADQEGSSTMLENNVAGDKAAGNNAESESSQAVSLTALPDVELDDAAREAEVQKRLKEQEKSSQMLNEQFESLRASTLDSSPSSLFQVKQSTPARESLVVENGAKESDAADKDSRKASPRAGVRKYRKHKVTIIKSWPLRTRKRTQSTPTDSDKQDDTKNDSNLSPNVFDSPLHSSNMDDTESPMLGETQNTFADNSSQKEGTITDDTLETTWSSLLDDKSSDTEAPKPKRQKKLPKDNPNKTTVKRRQNVSQKQQKRILLTSIDNKKVSSMDDNSFDSLDTSKKSSGKTKKSPLSKYYSKVGGPREGKGVKRSYSRDPSRSIKRQKTGMGTDKKWEHGFVSKGRHIRSHTEPNLSRASISFTRFDVKENDTDRKAVSFAEKQCDFRIRYQINKTPPPVKQNTYICSMCSFSTTRLDNAIRHYKDQCPFAISPDFFSWEKNFKEQMQKRYEERQKRAEQYEEKTIKTSTPLQNPGKGKKRVVADDSKEHGDKTEKKDEDKVRKSGSSFVEDDDFDELGISYLDSDDSEDLPSPFEIQAKNIFGFSEDEVVWAEWKNIHWPALVRKLYPKTKKVSVMFIDNPAPKRGIRLHKKKIATFNNAEQNKKFIGEGRFTPHEDTFMKAVQKAEDFLRKRCLGSQISARQFFEHLDEFDMSDDETSSLAPSDSGKGVLERPIGDANSSRSHSPVSFVDIEKEEDPSHTDVVQVTNSETLARMKEKRKQQNAKLLRCIKEGKVETHLLGVYRGTIPSDRHNKFHSDVLSERKQLKHVSWFGPIDDEEQQEEIYDYCLQHFKSNCDYTETIDVVAYMFEVWVPEAIVKAISRVKRVTMEQAEAIFAKGVELTELEQRELSKEFERTTMTEEEKQEHLEKAAEKLKLAGIDEDSVVKLLNV